MKGRIISCFSCVGKTHYVLNNLHLESCIDHDFYDYMYRGNLGENWMGVYMTRMRQLQKKFEYVYVNSTPEIIAELPKDSILVYPYPNLKNEWVQRAKNRGGESAFPKLLEKKWDEWIAACESWTGKKYMVNSGEYLSNVFDRFKTIHVN